jgi:outer membrane protein OmpA-like peptidoglycan-associated protein
MMSRFFLSLLLICAGSEAYAERQALQVLGYLSTGTNSRHVMLSGGRDQGVVSGEVFRVVRIGRVPQAAPVETGMIKVISVDEEGSVAEVISDAPPENAAMLAPFAEVMAGDVAKPQRISIARAQVLTPEIMMKCSAIFDDPKAMPSTYELTLAGKKALRDVARQISFARAGMLLVEAHTDPKGTLEQNQIESYQRALTIRQFLIEDLGFDEERVTAIGMGESEPLETTITPGYADRARRIVFKMVPCRRQNNARMGVEFCPNYQRSSLSQEELKPS